MGRKIILLSDGTGNSSAKVWRTNVWRTFEALDLSGNDQVAFYDDGVGTSSFKPLAILGGAFGFGFSRGAFTIRIVMGMIDSQGLIKAEDEDELDSLAKAAYRAYRRDRYENLKLEAPYQWIRNKFGPHYPPPGVRRNIRIRFIGAWDTVASRPEPDGQQSQRKCEQTGIQTDCVVGSDVEHATSIAAETKSYVRSGMSTYIAAPPLAASPARIRPWCCVTIHRAIDRPSPAPLPVRARSDR